MFLGDRKRANVGGTPYGRNLRPRLESPRSTDMGFDSPITAGMHVPLEHTDRGPRTTHSNSGLPGGPGARIGARGMLSAADREQFFADVQALELRLAIIDDRFERLAARPDDAFQAFRRDTLTRMRSVAERARALEVAGHLAVERRRHVAAVLTLVRRRVAQLDMQHASHGDRRARRRDGPSVGQRSAASYSISASA
ncbi:hypothetical protein [Agromyces sp. NPDC058110]|uniref:hypothetical protein n=1 Tax=Agromyces sp. NPDC058110 TaxID=3346345 RepID=UPI0036DA6B31